MLNCEFVSLFQISLPNEERRNSSRLYNPMTIEKLQQKFPSIPWLEYFHNILPANIKVGEDEVIIVEVPEFITKLEYILSQTPKR